MTLTVRSLAESDEKPWRGLWRAPAVLCKTNKSGEIFEKMRAGILKPSMDAPACFGLPAGLVGVFNNALYHKGFRNIKARSRLTGLPLAPNAREARAGQTVIQAVVSRLSGRNSAPFCWLTTNDNVQARQLDVRVAILTPFVEYPV